MRADREFERAKRDLVRRIGRNRRRVEGRVHTIHRRGLRWILWAKCATWAWRHLQAMWTESAAKRRPEPSGDDHGRS